MMATARRPLVAGNWKMNGLTTSLAELDRMIAAAPRLAPKGDLMVCPPAALMAACAARAAGSALAIGGQDCHAEAAGAFAGNSSAGMLQDAGAAAVIVVPSQ